MWLNILAIACVGVFVGAAIREVRAKKDPKSVGPSSTAQRDDGELAKDQETE